MDGLWPGSIGAFDVEVLLAEATHWTPEQIYEQDPDFIDQLVSKLSANALHKPKTTKGSPRAAGAQSRRGGGPQRIVEEDPDY